MGFDPWTLSTWILPALLSITLHEAAHGARTLALQTAGTSGALRCRDAGVERSQEGVRNAGGHQ